MNKWSQQPKSFKLMLIRRKNIKQDKNLKPLKRWLDKCREKSQAYGKISIDLYNSTHK